MTVEVGQIWKHDTGKTGLTVWEILEVFVGHGNSGYCNMKLLVDRDPELSVERITENAMKVGSVREYPLNLFGRPVDSLDPDLFYWEQIEREDIPLLILAGLP